MLVKLEKLLIFDFDGVVVDSLDLYEGTVRQCLEEIGQPIVRNREDFLELFEDNFYESLVKKGVDLHAFMEASADILARANFDEMKPFYNLIPVLEKLQTNNILLIISSSGSQDIRNILASFNLSEFFRDVLGSDANLSKKEKILRALNKYPISREQTYYIGDTTGDIKEAKSTGIKTIAVTWGWHTREKLAHAHPDYFIDSPDELLKI